MTPLRPPGYAGHALATPVRASGDCIIDHAGRVVAITNAPGAGR